MILGAFFGVRRFSGAFTSPGLSTPQRDGFRGSLNVSAETIESAAEPAHSKAARRNNVRYFCNLTLESDQRIPAAGLSTCNRSCYDLASAELFSHSVVFCGWRGSVSFGRREAVVAEP